MQLSVATLAVAAAFAPASPNARPARPMPRSSTPAMSELGLAATVVRDVSVLPTMYALMSLNEYMTHRYFQHLEFNRPENFEGLKGIYSQITGEPAQNCKVPGDGHVEHHAETYDDMSLKNDKKWQSNSVAKALDEDVYRGTAFHWSATLIMTIQMSPSVFPTFMLMGWSPLETLAILLPCMLVHAIVWNAVHPPMHGLPPVSLLNGFGTGSMPGGAAFSEWILESAYGRYIYENHMGHHVLGGQANYNVCCPMTDHLLGTYVPTDEWKPKMRPLPLNAVVRGPPVPPLSNGGVPQLPTIEEYKALQLLQKQMKEMNGEAGEKIAAVANGGSIIADAYSSEEELKVESEALLKK